MKKITLILSLLLLAVTISNCQININPDSVKVEVKKPTITKEQVFSYIDSISQDTALLPDLLQTLDIVSASIPKQESNAWDWIKWVLIGIVPILLKWANRLIPTHNKHGLFWLNIIDTVQKILSAIVKIVPNNKKGGGKHVD